MVFVRLGAHPGERARRFREPHVVADRDPEAADVRNVEYGQPVARGDAVLVRLERVDLAVAGDDLPGRVDHRRGVVDAVAVTLVEGAGQEPQAVLAGDGAVAVFRRPRHRLGALERDPVSRELRDEHHVDPGKAAPDRRDLGRDRVQVVAVAEFQLQRSQTESAHGPPQVASRMTRPWGTQ
jgi:hypothetical protein